MTDDGGVDSEIVRALDRERAEIVLRRRDARETSKRGLILMGSVPLVLIGAFAAATLHGTLALVLVVLAMIYSALAGIGGLVMLTAGSAEHYNLDGRLASLEQVRLLPPARVVRRR